MAAQLFVKPWLALSQISRPLSEPQLVPVVQRYSVSAWLMILARIDRCLLFKQVDADTQCRVASALFGVSAEPVIRAIRRTGAVAFHDQQLRYAMRLALLHGCDGDDRPMDSPATMMDVGGVLLGINDHLVDPESATLLGSMGAKAKAHAFLNLSLRGGEAFRRTLTATSMTRDYELLVSRPRALDAVGAVELEREIARDLGVDLPGTIALGYAVLSQCFLPDPFATDVPLAIRDPMAWFEGIGMGDGVKRRFLELMTQELVHARANAQAETTLARLYDYEKFEKWPIIRMPNGMIVVPSTELLYRRISSGMYPLLIHLAKRANVRDLRERIQTRRAAAFEAILREAFDGEHAEAKLLKQRNYQRPDGSVVEAGDAVVVDHAGGRVLVFEAKSGQIDRRDRLTGTADDLFGRDGPIHAALITLSRLVRDIRDGILSVGLPLQRIKSIAPVIVAADEFFWTPQFRDRLIAEADSRMLAATTQVMPISVCGLEEIGVVRTRALTSRRFVDAVFDWLRDREWRGTTFHNYLGVKLHVEYPAETVHADLGKFLLETIVADLNLRPADGSAGPPPS